MIKKILPLIVLLGALVGTGGCATHYGDVSVRGRDYDMRVVFSDRDRVLIRDYYRSSHRDLPPGLAKKGKVPPGHAKRLYPQQAMPPGVEWRYLPDKLERRLSRLPADYVRIIVGGDIGIMNVHTRVIMDLIEDLDD